MDILKQIIKNQEAEYKKAKSEREVKQLLKLLKANPEWDKKIHAWAYADYMRINSPNSNGRDKYEKSHKAKHDEITEIIRKEEEKNYRLSNALWNYKHYVKKQIERDGI